jgi:DNA-binding CsgD family transcriptional regulator
MPKLVKFTTCVNTPKEVYLYLTALNQLIKSLFSLVFLFFWASSTLLAQHEVFTIPSDFKSHQIVSGFKILNDVKQSCTIQDILTGNNGCSLKPYNFNKIYSGSYLQNCWYSFEVNSNQQKELYLQLKNGLLKGLNIYLVAENKIVQQYLNFSPATPISSRSFPRSDFVFYFDLKQNTKYTIYVSHNVTYSGFLTSVNLWTKESLEAYTQNSNYSSGILYGILLIVILVCFLVEVLFKIRIFSIFGINVLAVILMFSLFSGSLFVYLPYKFFINSIYDSTLLLMYSPFIVHLFFVRSFTRIHLSKVAWQAITFKIIIFYIIFIFFTTLFVPLWGHLVPWQYLKMYGTFNLNMFYVISLIFLYFVAQSYNNSSFAKFYFWVMALGGAAVFFLMLMNSNIIPFRVKHLMESIVVFSLLGIMVGMLYEAKVYLKFAEIKEFVPDTKGELLPERNTNSKETPVKNVPEHSILTKRETEILKAFANGFTHAEIADALFLSPHTVKTHIKTIYRKLDINSKVEAVHYVMENVF